jgi:hypothetical protein
MVAAVAAAELMNFLRLIDFLDPIIPVLSDYRLKKGYLLSAGYFGLN